jgi:hypothetical protein
VIHVQIICGAGHSRVRYGLRVIASLRRSVSERNYKRTFGFPKKTVSLERLIALKVWWWRRRIIGKVCTGTFNGIPLKNIIALKITIESKE